MEWDTCEINIELNMGEGNFTAKMPYYCFAWGFECEKNRIIGTSESGGHSALREQLSQVEKQMVSRARSCGAL